MTKEKIQFIINPISGGRNKSGFEQLVRTHLDPLRFEPYFDYTKGAEHASILTEDALEAGFTKVVAVGGDGTVNEVAKTLIHKDVALGIIPFGSGNGLARHMGIPMNTIKAIQVLNNPTIKLNDAGVINDKPFFCTSGIGFDAHIGKIFATMKGRGFGGYVKAVLKEFAAYTAQPYKLSINGQKITPNAFLITFANATQYGNNAHIAPKAEVNDGLIDVCVLKPFPVYSMPALAVRVFAKTADRSKYMDSYRGTEILIEREQAGPIHLDGEPFEMGKEIKVTVIPSCLKIMTL